MRFRILLWLMLLAVSLGAPSALDAKVQTDTSLQYEQTQIAQVVIDPFTMFGGGGANWASGFDGAWGRRIKVTIQSSEVSATLTNFPVYVRLSDLPASFFSNVQSAGEDIRVTKTDAVTELPVEIVAISTGGSTGEIHIEVDSISSSSNTDIYIYYDNSGASLPAVTDTYGRNAVWATYRAVYHLEDSNPGTTVIDSTVQSFDMTDVGTLVSGDSVDSKIGKGVQLERSKSQGLFNNNDPFTGFPFSYSGWLDVSGSITGRGSLWVGDKDAINVYFELSTNLDFKVVLVARNTTTQFLLSSATYGGQTIFIVVVFRSGTDREVYVNGVSIMGGSGQPIVAYSAAIDRLAIGYGADSGPDFGDSIIDERRFINATLSVAEITSQYTNQNTPTTFYVVGTEESI